ncbi:AMP-binding protein [Litoribaculum gwangyangense]|uniref:AMP-binding protein n=1 Tax=Litoribaculum gwangyangense TaxID=1130722 RepID=A0ABP9CCG5_9FLAO
MVPDYTKVHIKFKLNGIGYNHENLMEVAYSYVKEGLPFQQELGNFLLDWLDKKDFIIVKTSGSTGKPKKIKIKKEAMVNSAIATGDFFKLKPGNKALHCLPSNFIAGKMMLIRAIVLGLELDMVEPKAMVIINSKKSYHFCALTPMQLKNFSKNLKRFKTIIVGGGRVSESIIESIQNINCNIYETFGMTETVSHIAVKKLNNFDATQTKTYFKTLPHITISLDDRSCLIIEAPFLSNKKIVTNDLVKLHSVTSFEWLGRYDNVINSGGIKLFPEQIEQKLQNKIVNRFFITSIFDDTLGEKVILIVEGKTDIDTKIFESLNNFEKPREVFYVSKFQETKSGKIQRANTLKELNLHT